MKILPNPPQCIDLLSDSPRDTSIITQWSTQKNSMRRVHQLSTRNGGQDCSKSGVVLGYDFTLRQVKGEANVLCRLTFSKSCKISVQEPPIVTSSK